MATGAIIAQVCGARMHHPSASRQGAPMWFILKKLVSRLLFPLPLSLGLALLAWSCSGSPGARGRQGAGHLGVLLMFALSTEFVSDGLLVPLEARHAPYGLQEDTLSRRTRSATSWSCLAVSPRSRDTPSRARSRAAPWPAWWKVCASTGVAQTAR